MGGKSYFCDYCRCYMKNDKNVRKTHNDGLHHKIIKTSIMRRYEDPRKLYEEEVNKQPCVRYFKSYCKYGLYCQYSHFNEIQLMQLKNVVEYINSKVKSSAPNAPNMKQLLNLPWQSPISKRIFKLLPPKLPLSLKPINLRKLSKLDIKRNMWGC